MKTIFITSFHPLISRNVFSTDIISRLTSRGDLRVVALVPDYKKDFFEKNYGQANVIFEGIATGISARSKRVGFFKRLAEAMPNTKRAAIGRWRTLSGKAKSPAVYYLFYFPIGMLGRFLWFHKLVRFVDFYLSPKGRFTDAINCYHPDLIFSTDIQNESDVALMQDAKRADIFIAGMVRSWDNLTTRALRIIPDRILVHNEIIREEAVRLHGVPSSRIITVGIPHYDRYVKGPTMERKRFFETIGADHDKKLIVYFPVCDYRLLENNVDRMMLEILSTFGENILVRFPPAASVAIGDFAKQKYMTFDRPGHIFEEKRVDDRDITVEDDTRLINALAWCDAVVSGPSTAVIDAAFFDKPIILVDFYPRQITATEKIYEYGAEHMASILESGGVRVAKSRDEFLNLIEQYLRHPELDRAGRRKIVEEQCWRADAQSSQRIAGHIYSLL